MRKDFRLRYHVLAMRGSAEDTSVNADADSIPMPGKKNRYLWNQARANEPGGTIETRLTGVGSG